MEIRMLEDSIQVEGYVNVTERKSKIMTDKTNGKKFVEVIKQGTFKRAIDNNKNIVMLLDHDFSKQIGKVGDNLELMEDSIGLHYRATITDAETIELAKNNKISGLSFGFNKAIGYKTTNNVLETREIKDLDLKEVSILSYRKSPAYDGCSIEVRSLENEDIEQLEIRELNDSVEDIPNFDVYNAELFILKNKQI